MLVTVMHGRGHRCIIVDQSLELVGTAGVYQDLTVDKQWGIPGVASWCHLHGSNLVVRFGLTGRLRGLLDWGLDSVV